MIRKVFLWCAFTALLLLLAGAAAAQDLASFEARTTLHKLANGWTFLIVERPTAPVFSFVTLADAGSSQDVPGITGLAHMFEHMAFKGTTLIGTKDPVGEAKALADLEAAYQAYQAERLAPRPDAARLEGLLAEFKTRQAEAAGYVVPNELDSILTREGAAAINAVTDADRTMFFYSLPSNKVELFAFLESERFYHPVFREFYEERKVVQEERRMRYESQPLGRLAEQLRTTAFQHHPYGQPGIGTMSDLDSMTMTDAENFFETYYAPSNLYTVIVGNVEAVTLIPLIDKYFGRIPARPAPPPLRAVEPPQIAERTVVLEDPGQPSYLEAYHRPAQTHPDQPVYDAIEDVLTNGRTSRLYRSLVHDRKLAANVQALSGFPGKKYPNLWGVLVVPAAGVTHQQIQTALREELDRLKTEDVTDGELARFKARSKENLLRSLRSNQGLAIELAEHQCLDGDWRELFRSIDRLDRVTKADIRRVAEATFQAPNRTVAMTVRKDDKENP
ncbi:MAG TPA: pitrilysin family protein [Thermoanaerobaculia bacterium]|nr:pitrilysin family protein [Thermoanaerobaculia bacterium]